MRKILFLLVMALSFLIVAPVDAAAVSRFHRDNNRRDNNCDNINVDAGQDETIDSDETVRLDGSVDGSYDRLDWECSGGKISDDGILRPTFDPPNSYDGRTQKTFTCTLTARNDCDSDSDTVRITVNYERESNRFRVVLRAKPKSSCAPSDNVDLIATLEDYEKRDFDYTYKFDCDNDGDWEKTITTEDTEYTARDLCDYRYAGTYTARVRVEGRNRTVSDTVIVHANDCRGGEEREVRRTGQVSITKMVRNVSRNSNYQGSVMASPSDVISYKIVVTAVSGNSDNVFVRDSMPAGLVYTGGVQVDGSYYGGDLISGINIGRLVAGQTKEITYNAVVAAKSSFIYGNTALTNISTITVGSSTASSYATVNVYRSSVSGATSISTGVGYDPSPALALVAAMLIWISLMVAQARPLRRISRNIR